MIELSAIVALGLIFLFALLGVHIALAFILGSTVGIYILFGDWDVTLGILEQTAFGNLRDYNLMVIPLFAVMGLIIARSGAARDLFSAANSGLRLVPARLAVATVAGNALFAAVTGVGVASAATFSQIAYPPMRQHGYKREFSAGCIAGSSVLGLLIPPSVFMIVWAILTEQSIGRLFAAGILPGLLLACMFGVYCMGRAIIDPNVISRANLESTAELEKADPIGIVGVVLIMVLTLGGIWGGFFTPTEGSAVGMAGAVLLAYKKGMSTADIWRAAREAGMIVTPIMMLLLGAAMYSKLLALAGIPQMVGAGFEEAQLGPLGTILIMCLVWLVLGCFVDSISIMLLTVPLFWPVAQTIGLDPIVFALVGILVIEAGVLTPPFGIGAFVVLSAIPDNELRLKEVFVGLVPYWLMILGVAVMIYMFPQLATYIPSKI